MMNEPPEAERHEQAVEIRFRMSEASVPVLSAADRAGTRVNVEGIHPRAGGGYAKLCRLDGGEPGAVARRAADGTDSETRVLSRAGNGGLLEVRETDGAPSLVLAAHGAFPRRLWRGDGGPILSANVPSPYDADEIIGRFLDAYPGADLTAVESRSSVPPTTGNLAFKAALEECLTTRQWEALQNAYESGYYQWPRAVTAEGLAEEMDITPPTFCEHLRAAEQQLYDLLF